MLTLAYVCAKSIYIPIANPQSELCAFEVNWMRFVFADLRSYICSVFVTGYSMGLCPTDQWTGLCVYGLSIWWRTIPE